MRPIPGLPRDRLRQGPQLRSGQIGQLLDAVGARLASTAPMNVRATRARSTRPATVTLSRIAAAPTRPPPFRATPGPGTAPEPARRTIWRRDPLTGL
jgi:hypothetical protein